MTREVRANLIFIVCLILLCSPGFFLLMRRKLNGTSTSSNSMPDAVHTTVAYVQPLPVDPRLPRVEPPVVRDWVAKLIPPRAGAGTAANVLGGASGRSATTPLVSDRFITQFIDLSVTDGHAWRVSLLRWDDSRDLAAAPPTVAVDFTDGPTEAKADRAEPIAVPPEVRHALQDVGWVDPPGRVWWISASIDHARTGEPRAVRLRVANAPAGSEETIIFPARAAASSTEPAR